MLDGILAEAKESYKYIRMWHTGSKFTRGRLSACAFVSTWIGNQNNIYIHLQGLWIVSFFARN